jgi:hypothetical protein
VTLEPTYRDRAVMEQHDDVPAALIADPRGVP